jgi:hypothetical protein
MASGGCIMALPYGKLYAAAMGIPGCCGCTIP